MLNERTFNSVFNEHGIPDVVKWDAFLNVNGIVKLTFESSSSKWRQGVWLRADSGLLVKGIQCPSVDLWIDTAPHEVLCCGKVGEMITVYNIWERENRRSSLSHSSGMLVEEIPNGRRYRCNDIGFTTGFDKIVFRLEHMVQGHEM